MKKQIGVVTLAAILCCGIQMQAADESARSAAQIAHDEAQQLLKDRDEALPKAKVAEQKMRDNGQRPESLGFENAKELRDRQAASGAKAKAYERYAKTAKQMEKKIRDEVYRGALAIGCEDIARYERLQAEVDLARIAGRLPAQEN